MLHAIAVLIAYSAPSGPSAAVRPAASTPDSSTLRTYLADLLGPTFDRTTLTAWIVLLGAIFSGLVLGRVAQSLLKRAAERFKVRGWQIRSTVIGNAANPASLAIFAIALQIGLQSVYVEPGTTIEKLPAKVVGLLLVISLSWFLYNLVDLVEIGIRRVTDDDTILLLIRKTLRIFLLVVFGMFIAQNTFEANISAWLAGLGLAGLAVSLAAQGPIKNIFGSVTVVLDRPFGLGDRIKFGDAIGTVETMGFRSTKLRTMDGHLVTIPNMKLIDDVVENISARPSIRRNFNITITYDTPPEKVEQAVQTIKSILAEPFMADTFEPLEFPGRVFFNNFNADSLNIGVTYWYQLNVEGRDWWTFQAQCEQFNMKLLRAFGRLGIEFAFPTQTLYLAGDANRQLTLRLEPENGALAQAR